MRKVLVVGIIVLLICVVTISTGSADTDNYPPTPPTIEGPTSGKPGVTYDYTFNSVDLDGHNISYYIDWGDGTSDGWTSYFNSGIDITLSHTWEEINWDNTIRAKAKDIYGKESDWSTWYIPILENIENSISSPFEMFVEHGAESDDNNKPLGDDYKEVITIFQGTGDAHTGLLLGVIGFNLHLYGGAFELNCYTRNPIGSYTVIASSVHMKIFIGILLYYGPEEYAVGGLALGDISWEPYE